MREIKFRGKTRKNEWVYGKLLESNFSSFIVYMVNTFNGKFSSLKYEEVFPETVGQYTVEKDKNGKETFAGDVISCNHMGFCRFNAQIKLGEYTQDGSGGEYQGTQCIGFYAEVIDKDQVDEFGIKIVTDYLETTSLLEFDDFEIIGNVFDNPELLEVTK
jgi:uncharacterized phage protein (TIGR01671 family)